MGRFQPAFQLLVILLGCLVCAHAATDCTNVAGTLELELVDVSGTDGATPPLAKCFKSLTIELTANCVLSASSSVTSNVYVPAVWTGAGVHEYKECPGAASSTSVANYATGVTEAHLATLLGGAIWSGATVPIVTAGAAGSGILTIANSGTTDEFGEWTLKFRATMHTGSSSGIFAVEAPACTTGAGDECSVSTNCGAGRHYVAIAAPATGYVCALCAAGTYKTASGSSQCSLCVAGTEKPQVGSTTSCAGNDCGAGSGAPEGSSNCVPCSPGSFATADHTECQVCPGFWSSHVYGASACVKCTNGRPATCDGSVGSPCTDNTPGTSGDFVATVPSDSLVSASGFSSYPGLLGTCAASGTTLAFAVSGTCSVEIRALGVSTLFPATTGLQCSHPNNVQATQTAYYSSATTITSLPSLTAASTMISIGSASSASVTLTVSGARVSPTATLPTAVSVTLTVTGGQLAGSAASVATCPAKTFLESGSVIGDVSCAPCPVGSFCTSGSTTDTMCDAGQQQPLLGGTCSNCGDGTYASYPGAATCSTCTGTVVNDSGMNVTSAGTGCQSTCTGDNKVYDEETATCGCAAGYGVVGSNCVQCAVNKYSPGGAEACTDCPEGATALAGSASCSLCLPGQYYNSTSTECEECGPGMQPNSAGTGCEACPAGFYNDGNLGLCARCMGGYKVVKTGSLNTGCSACPAGSYSVWTGTNTRVPAIANDNTCEPCAEGTYAKLTGQKRCLTCPGGTWAAATGAVACVKCAPGKFRPPFGGACSDCPTGHSTNGKLGATSCRPCSSGEYSASAGAAVCVPCAENTFSGPKAMACSKCPAGTDTTGEKGAGQCSECAPGMANSIVGSSCAECSAGTFSSAYGASDCRKCPLGSFSEDGGAETCEICPAGHFAPKTGQKACRVCPAGTFSTPGKGSCTLCPVGKVSPSPGSTRCAACLPGTTATAAGQKECDECPAGHRCPTTAAAPEACPAGTYQDKTGQRVCRKCPKGTYVSGTGNTSCLPCPTNVNGGMSTCV